MDTKKKKRIIQAVMIGVILLLSSSFLFVMWKTQTKEEGDFATLALVVNDYQVPEQLQQEQTEKSNEQKKDNEEPNKEPSEKSEEKQVEQKGEEQTAAKKEEEKETSHSETKTEKPKEEAPVDSNAIRYVSVSIDCTNVLDHMELVNDSVKRFIPADGIILAPIQIAYEEKDTAFSILQKACAQQGISLTASGGYVKYISNFGERDAGGSSGWLYQVNGVTPTIGSAGYQVKENDVIAWRFTLTQGDV